MPDNTGSLPVADRISGVFVYPPADGLLQNYCPLPMKCRREPQFHRVTFTYLLAYLWKLSAAASSIEEHVKIGILPFSGRVLGEIKGNIETLGS